MFKIIFSGSRRDKKAELRIKRDRTVDFAREQFLELMKKNLGVPVKLYQL